MSLVGERKKTSEKLGVFPDNIVLLLLLLVLPQIHPFSTSSTHHINPTIQPHSVYSIIGVYNILSLPAFSPFGFECTRTLESIRTFELSFMMGSHVVKVKRQPLEACMTCPLCHKLLKDATTISLCLHTFCRTCIYERFSDEEADCCPVCNIDLGCLPVEKLRPDHNLQDIRAKVFPLRGRKIKAPEAMPSIPLPAKRKERSLSSLVISAPKVPIHSGFTGKRTKTATRKAAALRGCNFGVHESIKKEEVYAEDNLDSSTAGPSKKNRPDEDAENNVEFSEGKVDLWTPLNCLVEAANRTKSSKSTLQGLSVAKTEPPLAPNGGVSMPEITTKSEPPATAHGELRMPKTKNKDNGHKAKFGDDKVENAVPSGQVRRRKVRPASQKRAAASETSASAQVMLDAVGGRCNRENCPIWFSLVASEDQKVDVPLPQIPACYLRIK